MPLLVQTEKTASKSPGKKNKKKEKEAPPKEIEVKYPFDDVLPSMIDKSIDDFIQAVAEKKA